jgi:translation initiation factor 2B subunit (eIF-2B alpha/beta/delta family)
VTPAELITAVVTEHGRYPNSVGADEKWSR